MDSENLGARIMENRALDQKICALKAFGGKTNFLGVSRVILEFLEWLEGFGAKDRGSCDAWKILGIFMDFWIV
jgi:hypothetical protein